MCRNFCWFCHGSRAFSWKGDLWEQQREQLARLSGNGFVCKGI